MDQDKIFVLDFGGQYTQLIAKAVRKCNVFSEIKACEYSLEQLAKDNPGGIILSGGPDSVFEEGAPKVNPDIFNLGIPVLGICYGMQHINHLFGGGMLHGDDVVKEYGETEVRVYNDHPLFSGLENKISAWMSHGDSVDEANLARGFGVIAQTEHHAAAIANDDKKIYGVQFHPEVTHTPKGVNIVSNFVHDICGCSSDWNMGNYIEISKQDVKNTVGKNDVIVFVSGGVDSTYTAALISQTKGIGNVHCVYIGALMRKGENEEVIESLKNAGVENLIFKECEDRFIQAVEGMQDPEQKRKAIGNLFGTIMQEVTDELKLDPEKTFLAQGTLYTDLIESGKGVGKKAANIKSHHNVGCKFIEDMKKAGRIVEPNRLIFKDEVREAAKEIGLPPEIYKRQPYPGPGLGIRIVDGDPKWANPAFGSISERVSQIAAEQGFEGYLVPIKTVGVQGDGRTYSYLTVLRGERDWKRIREAAKRIPKEVRETNRVVYDIGQNQIEGPIRHLIIPSKVNRQTIDQLKDIDYIGRKIISQYGFDDKISQTIFVLFGADLYATGKRSVALRGVSTDDFMTVSPIEPVNNCGCCKDKYDKNAKMSWGCLDEIAHVLKSKYDVGAFVIDVTDKPPSTTCWE